jgi:hypothetical protein
MPPDDCTYGIEEITRQTLQQTFSISSFIVLIYLHLLPYSAVDFYTIQSRPRYNLSTFWISQ